MSITSMTGFASLGGSRMGYDWQWEARSVNARGLDIRLRLPEGFDALEPKVRTGLQAQLKRGSVQVSLRLAVGDTAEAETVNQAALDQFLVLADHVRNAAQAAGIPLAPISLGDVLGHRGVMENGRSLDRLGLLQEALEAQIPELAARIAQAREGEGQALSAILFGQIDIVDTLIRKCAATAEARAARTGETLRTRVAALMDSQDRIDEARIAQELAILAVKSDVTEELDRLRAHVAAARDLLGQGGAVGRKLDFLMQEFNREANTLCSKSQDTDLTALGLELKVVIDQMREQSQNVE